MSYFSLATITTTGYGDLAPVHPLARSLANLEAAFGMLFPATFLARLVALLSDGQSALENVCKYRHRMAMKHCLAAGLKRDERDAVAR